MLDGMEIQARREALGLSVAELAAVCGVTRSTVGRWERGQSPCAPDTHAVLDGLESFVDGVVDAVAGAGVDAQPPVILWAHKSEAGLLRAHPGMREMTIVDAPDVAPKLHRVALGRALRELRLAGVDASIAVRSSGV